MNISSMILSIAMQMSMDPMLVLSVVQVESNLNPNMTGKFGEVGLMQIRPEYSKLSKIQLLNPKQNIKEGIIKLKEARKHCKHQVDDTWLVCYNVGITGGSKIKHPKLFPYYKKVKEVYETLAQNESR